MSIAEKFEVIADEVYEKGKRDEYDKFWDNFQSYGKPKKYQYAFFGDSWNDNNFKPKYDIICGSGLNSGAIFYTSTIKDLEGILNTLGRKLDTSGSVNLDNLFNYSSVTAVPEIDATSCSGINSMFYNATALKTIRKLILKEDGSQKFTSPFTNCKALENITIEGTIGQNGFNVSACTKLSGESIASIIEALSTATSGLSVTLSQTAVDNMVFPITGNKGTYNSWSDLEQTKTNWTISLV